MNWPRRFASILVILTIIIFENVSSNPDLDRAKRFETGEDVGEPLYLTPLINKNEVQVARDKARVYLPITGTNVESYSGFLTVNEETNSNLFFWFISAAVNPRSAPVIVYVEGGPGMTSFFNSFLQHGPFNLTSKGELEMARRTNIWFNTIYIDSLAGTGFSFMHQDAAYPRTHKRIAQELLEALKQFFKMCAHFRGNDFYVAGESMTGKIVPRLTSAIHFDNEKVSQEEKINLKGMIIGNGFMDPKNQLAYGKYLNAMGLIDNKTALQLESLETKIRTLIGHHNHIRAYDVVTNLFALLRQKIGYCSAVNILEPNSNTDPYSFVPWLERSDVRKALHVGSKPFTMLSYEAMEALKRVMTQSAANIIGAMLENYRTLVYTGNFGIACPYSSVHKSLLEIEWSGKKEFAAARQSQWRVPQESPDVSNVTGVLAGYVRKYNNLYEVLVRNAGHFPYMDQGNRMLQLLNHFVQNKL